MGLHPEHEVAEYWNTDPHKGPLHLLVSSNISLVRWQQLDRFFHVAKPKPQQQIQQQAEQIQQKESPFEKVEPLNEELRQKVKQYWNPTTHLAVDEGIQRFQGRAKETVKVPLKPIPEGFKIWCLANDGYILDWLYHARSSGPVDLDNYWTVDCGFPATQAVVLDLLLQAGIHNDSRHIVWLDNLFTSTRLLSTLREEGFGAAGTVRTTKTKAEWIADTPAAADTAADTAPATQQQSRRSKKAAKAKPEPNRGLKPSLTELKTDFSSQIPWGKLYGCLSADGKVLQFAWKDQNVVLFMSTVSKSPPDFIRKLRKRPAQTATNARTSRAVFGK